MPYTKTGQSEFRDLEALIKGYMSVENKTSEDIGDCLGVHKNTAKKYINDPSQLTLRMLMKLRRNIHAPREAWREAAIK